MKYLFMRNYYSLLLALFFPLVFFQAQNVSDDFEGSGTITTWYGDNCGSSGGLGSTTCLIVLQLLM